MKRKAKLFVFEQDSKKHEIVELNRESADKKLEEKLQKQTQKKVTNDNIISQ